jgi:hypothetical protein
MFTEVRPPGRVQAPSTGLLASASEVQAGDREPQDAWSFGFRWRPVSSFGGGWFDPCDAFDEPDTAQADRSLVHVRPVGYYVTDECGMTAPGPDEQAVRAYAEASASYHVARELWTGAATDAHSYEIGVEDGFTNARLAAPTAETVGTGMNVRVAIGALEQAARAALGGQQPMIHVPVSAVAALDGLRRVGNLLLTQTDGIVVADAGYPGTGPAGEAATATSMWAYATGPVGYRLGPIDVPSIVESLDRSTNRRLVHASRLFAVAFDPAVHYAASITLPSPAA